MFAFKTCLAHLTLGKHLWTWHKRILTHAVQRTFDTVHCQPLSMQIEEMEILCGYPSPKNTLQCRLLMPPKKAAP